MNLNPESRLVSKSSISVCYYMLLCLLLLCHILFEISKIPGFVKLPTVSGMCIPVFGSLGPWSMVFSSTQIQLGYDRVIRVVTHLDNLDFLSAWYFPPFEKSPGDHTVPVVACPQDLHCTACGTVHHSAP